MARYRRGWISLWTVAAIAVLLVVPGVELESGGSHSNATGAIPLARHDSGLKPPPPIVSNPSIRGPPSPRPFDNTNHYWAGAAYNGGSTTATSLYADINVPDDIPDSSNFYYVLLSVWDNANSYDQLGIANDYGTWGVAYSWTNSCAGSYYYSANAYTLPRGETYQFEMTISSGTVTFTALTSSGNQLWTLNAATGGSNFALSEYYAPCSNDYDYTDYEESYDSTQLVPSYDFWFTNNLEDGTSETSWTAFTAGTAPSVTTSISGSTVIVENQPFFEGWSGGTPSNPNDLATQDAGSVLSKTLGVSSLSSDGAITISADLMTLPSGWSVNPVPNTGTPPYSSAIDVSIPSSTSPGNYEVQVVATDASSLWTRIGLTVTVNAPLTVTISPGSASINNGQFISLLGTWTGGTTAFTADLYSSTSTSTCSSMGTLVQTVSSATSPTSFNSVSPTTNPTYYCVGITDSAYSPVTGYSSTSTITVNPALGTPTLSPSTTTLDSGQPMTFSATWSGGTSTYKAVLYSSPTITCTASSTLVQTITPATSPQNFAAVFPTSTTYYCVVITDGATTPASTTSGYSTVTVDADPTVSVAPGGPFAYDAGQTASVLTATVTYSGPNTPTVEWYSSPSATCNSGSTATGASGLTFTPQTTTVGITFYCAVVADSRVSGYSSSSNGIEIAVSAALTTLALSPSAVAIDGGQSMSFSASWSGGTSPYTAALYSSSTFSCSASDVLVQTIYPATSPQTFATVAPTTTTYYCVAVTDNASLPKSALSSATTVTVNSPLAAPGIPTVSAMALDVEQVLTVSDSLSDSGTSPYAWQWLVSVNGGTYAVATQCAINHGSGAIAGSNETCSVAADTLTVGSTYAFKLEVTDHATNPENSTSSASPTVKVFNTPSVSVPSPTPASVDVGGTVSFSTFPSGGSGTYSNYAWTASSLGLGCTLANAATIDCKPTSAGNYTASVMVTDSIGGVSAIATSATFTVNAVLTVSSFILSPATTDIGKSVNMAVKADGGAGTLSYAWTGLPIGCDSKIASFTCTPDATGTFTISVNVTDANGVSATSSSATLVVNPALTAGASVSASSVPVNKAAIFSGTSTGGTAPISYMWRFGDGNSSTSQNPAHSYVSPGKYEVTLWVNDSAGASVVKTVSVTVTSSSGTGGGMVLGMPSEEAYVVIGILAAVAIVALLLTVLYMKRRKKESSSTVG